MDLKQGKTDRRSIRLAWHDYSECGLYYVTIVSQNRYSLFGDVVDGDMSVNDAGRMVTAWWKEIGCKFPCVSGAEHIVMPNHFHGLLSFDHPSDVYASVEASSSDLVGAALRGRPDLDKARNQDGRLRRAAPTLGDVIRWFKTMTTNAYIHGVKGHGWPPFPKRLWQRNYFERIVRNDE